MTDKTEDGLGPRDEALGDEDPLWESGLRGAFLEGDESDPREEANGALSALPFRLQYHEIRSEIGKGGMGRIHEAWDSRLGREVAIKTLHDQHLDDPRLLARFLDEARIAARLQHPGIVPIYDFGFDDTGRPWISMRRVEGQSFAELLKERGESASDRHRFLTLFLQVCQTLGYAHEHEIIHRDLKPANILIGRFGEVQVTDWGFAKKLGQAEEAPFDMELAQDAGSSETPEASSDSQHSIPGSALGTPGYLSPEQARGEIESVDTRSDVFALGAVLFEILVGHPPHHGRNALSDAREARLDHIPDELRTAGVDERLHHLVTRCLSKDREDRPSTAKPVAEELEQYLEAREEAAREAELNAARAESRLLAERKARRLQQALAALLVFVVLLASSAFWWSKLEEERASGNWRRTMTAIEDAEKAGNPSDALTELARAEGLLVGATVDDERRSRLADWRKRLELLGDRQKLLRNLTRLRLDPGRGPRIPHEYGQGFGRRGIDFREMSVPELATALRKLAGDSLPELSAALDDWLLRLQDTPPGDGLHRRVREVLEVLDGDTERMKIREALATRDRRGLQSLASSLDPKQTSARTCLLLGRALESIHEDLRAIQTLEIGIRQDDNSFWLHYRLAWLYRQRGPSGFDAAQIHAALARELRGEAKWKVFPEDR